MMGEEEVSDTVAPVKPLATLTSQCAYDAASPLVCVVHMPLPSALATIRLIGSQDCR